VRYLSICSGIEAATVAWHRLGWTPAAFAEIEAFPRAVLAHHYPDVPLHGDFTTIGADEYGPIDLLVGGTPCQSFSIAGLRGGLDDDRGNLALEFCRLARRTRPKWVVWENVPGVLSLDGGDAFASILGGLAECGYGLAYRVLDAQFVRVDGFGRAVPQRRRRVFVVGHLGDWRRAAAVLFERQSLRRDTPPRRKAGQDVAPTISARPTGGGGLGTDFDCDGGLIANALTSSGSGVSGPDLEHARAGHLVAATLQAKDGRGVHSDMDNFVAHALRAEGLDASEDGTGRGTPLVPIAFSSKDHGADAQSDCAPTLRAMGHADSHANAGGQLAIAIQERAVSENPDAGPDGAGVRDDGASYTLEARTQPQAVAFAENSRAELRLCGGDGTVSSQITTGGGKPGQGQPCVAETWAVRRLTPTECERLQGFPDGYTQVPYRGKSAADGPRYKALGNSMAVNVMRWIGRRIEAIEAMER
jgi:DNA (cytosine-5)-methyltransferase 1